MSDFYTLLDEYIGDGFETGDIRAVVRRCWFYDFEGAPVRVWDGQGRLHTSDGNVWHGTVDANGTDIHKKPRISDGRDGSSATYNFTLNIIGYPGVSDFEIYEKLRNQQERVNGRDIICYLGIFQPGEGLRPETPLVFFKQLEMISTKFSEKVELGSSNAMLKRYSATVTAKDGNSGRSNVPGGTYADTIQKERARQLGVSLDRGCEFVALLANRTYQLP